MKRFFLEFDFEPIPWDALPDGEPHLHGGAWDYTRQSHCRNHTYYGTEASSLRTVKGYIARVKKTYPAQCPHNFRIFDREAPDEPCGHVGQVYFQEI